MTYLLFVILILDLSVSFNVTLQKHSSSDQYSFSLFTKDMLVFFVNVNFDSNQLTWLIGFFFNSFYALFAAVRLQCFN